MCVMGCAFFLKEMCICFLTATVSPWAKILILNSIESHQEEVSFDLFTSQPTWRATYQQCSMRPSRQVILICYLLFILCMNKESAQLVHFQHFSGENLQIIRLSSDFKGVVYKCKLDLSIFPCSNWHWDLVLNALERFLPLFSKWFYFYFFRILLKLSLCEG